jgi:hypothetical protein
MTAFVTVFIRVLSAGCDVILIPVESPTPNLLLPVPPKRIAKQMVVAATGGQRYIGCVHNYRLLSSIQSILSFYVV